jgi:hypothetical protein
VAAEVFNGAGNGGHRDVVAVGGQEPSSSPTFLIQVGGLRGGGEGGAAVEMDSAAGSAARGGWHRDVDGTVERFQEPPEDRGGAVAQHCSLAAGEDRGHEAPVEARGAVAYRVDAVVDAVQPPTSQAP